MTRSLRDGDETSRRAFTAMMDMKKIDIATLDRAVGGATK